MFKNKNNKNTQNETQDNLSSSASIRQQFEKNVEFEILQMRRRAGIDKQPDFKNPKTLEEQKKIRDDFNRDWGVGKKEIPVEKILEAPVTPTITLGVDNAMQKMFQRRQANKHKRSQSADSQESAKETVKPSFKRSSSMSNA